MTKDEFDELFEAIFEDAVKQSYHVTAAAYDQEHPCTQEAARLQMDTERKKRLWNPWIELPRTQSRLW